MQLDDYVTDEQALSGFLSKLKKAVVQPAKFIAKETNKVAGGVTKAIGIKPGSMVGRAILKPIAFVGKTAVKGTEVATKIAFKPLDVAGGVLKAVGKPIEDLSKPKSSVAPSGASVPDQQAAATEQAMQQAYAPVASLPNSYAMSPGIVPASTSSGAMPGGFLPDQPADDFTPSGAPTPAPGSPPSWALPAVAGVALLLFLKSKSSPRRR